MQVSKLADVITSGIGSQMIALLLHVDTMLPSKSARNLEQPHPQHRVADLEDIRRGDMGTRSEDKVDSGLGLKRSESHNVLVAVDDVGRLGARNDPADD